LDEQSVFLTWEASAMGRGKVVALLVGLVCGGLLQTFEGLSADNAGQAPLKIAVAFVEDKSGYPSEGALSDVVQFILTQALKEVEAFEVIPADIVKASLAKLKLSPPLTSKEMVQLSAELKADWVVHATIECVRIDRSKGIVSVPLTAEALSGSLGVVVSKANACGTYKLKGDITNSVVVYGGIVGAISDACSKIAPQLEYSARQKALLLLPPMNNHIRANIGSHQGLKVGAELLIVWHERPLAWAKVIDVDYDDCEAVLQRIVAGARLEPNMKVLVVSNPLAHELPPYREQLEREIKKASRDLLISIALAFGVLIATDVIK
jgi:TolB-like protein